MHGQERVVCKTKIFKSTNLKIAEKIMPNNYDFPQINMKLESGFEKS